MDVPIDHGCLFVIFGSRTSFRPDVERGWKGLGQR
jgi:hypothetical protein